MAEVPLDIEAYRKAWRERRAREAQAHEDLRQQALVAARELAELLRSHGATRVWAYGSVLEPGRFDDRSDLDLVVEGVPKDRFYRAYGSALRALQVPVELDLCDLDELRPEVRARVLESGLAL